MKIVNAKNLLQAFASFFNAFSILCALSFFDKVEAVVSLSYQLAMDRNSLFFYSLPLDKVLAQIVAAAKLFRSESVGMSGG